jgi:hypothetical protein
MELILPQYVVSDAKRLEAGYRTRKSSGDPNNAGE